MPFCRYLLGRGQPAGRAPAKCLNLREKHFFCQFFPKECIYFFFLLPGGGQRQERNLFCGRRFCQFLGFNSLIS